MTAGKSILALDVGNKRIGVAIASLAARLPQPLTTLDAADDRCFEKLQQLIVSEEVIALVVGLPRNLSGQSTSQTTAVEDFVEQLRRHVTIAIHMQDEALTSQKAEEELERRGKPFQKAEIDALAATYILEDWLAEHPETTA